MTTVITRSAPSHLWDVTEKQRRQRLAKKDEEGKAIWTIEHLSEDQAFMRQKPVTKTGQEGAAHRFLMAELREDPISEACETCRRPLTPQRVKQVCEGCNRRAGRSRL